MAVNKVLTDLLVGGSLGIGTGDALPSEELHVVGRAIITDRLGIGGDFVPQKALHLKNAAPVFRMEDTDTASYAELVKTSSSFIFRLDPTGVEAASEIGFQVDGTETMVVKDGHVEALKIGINQVSPVASVDIVETSLPTTGQSYGVLLDMEKDSSTTAYTVGAFGLRSYARSVNTGTNQITDINALWSKAEHTGTGPTYFIIGSANRAYHNGSGNTGGIYGAFIEGRALGTGTGTHPYLIGANIVSKVDNANATVTNFQGAHISCNLTAGTVAGTQVLLLDYDSTGGSVSGDLEYLRIQNDTITATVAGDSRAIYCLSTLPSTFGGDITIGSSAMPETTLDVAGCVRIADDSTTASATTVGAMRYREAGTFSYFDMVMRTVAGYEWVNVVRNDFNV